MFHGISTKAICFIIFYYYQSDNKFTSLHFFFHFNQPDIMTVIFPHFLPPFIVGFFFYYFGSAAVCAIQVIYYISIVCVWNCERSYYFIFISIIEAWNNYLCLLQNIIKEEIEITENNMFDEITRTTFNVSGGSFYFLEGVVREKLSMDKRESSITTLAE